MSGAQQQKMHFDSLQGWLAWQESFHPRPIDLGLDRVRKVFQALDPDAGKPLPTITVAGTNGKGSCIAFLQAIYRAQGYRVGAYTSPHLLKYNERISIDGQPVADAVIYAAFERIEAVRDAVSLSYFEFGTLAALDIFRRSSLDVQLLEVGLGGRLDAVNIIDADTVIITSICIDHCDWLGETREAIGREKAGVFRSGVPAIIGDPEPPRTLLQSARAMHAPLLCINRDFHYEKQGNTWDWLSGSRKLTGLPAPALQGEHQYRNASSVLTAVEAMTTELPVAEKSIREGLVKASLPGRFQFVAGKPAVLLDVGHNPQAARSLADLLRQTFPGQSMHAVFAMTKDKDIEGVINIMKPLVTVWYIAPLTNPRTAAESVLRDAFESCKVRNVMAGFADFHEAVAMAKANANADMDDLILVFGSFFWFLNFWLNLSKGKCYGP